MSTLGLDLRQGLRGLRRNRLATALAVVSLALAIAGNSTVFSIVSAMLIRPLPFEEAERIVMLTDRNAGNALGITPESAANFLDLRERATSFEELVAFQGASLGLIGDAEPEAVSVFAASDGFFRLLRTDTVVGRPFLPAEQTRGSHLVAVLSYRFWQSHFAGEVSAVGETLNLSDEMYTIVGVMPEGSEFISPNTEIFVPLAIDTAAPGRRDQKLISVVGRLASDASVASADREVEAISIQLESEYPATNRGYHMGVVALRDSLVTPPNRRLVVLLQIALLLVLLIAAANVANLQLAQGYERRRELAVRAALGARRGAIARLLLTEALIVAALGGGLGLVFAEVGIRGLRASLAAQLPASFAPQLDGSVLLFTAAVSLLAGIIFGLLPALRASRPDLTDTLRDGARGSSGGPQRRLLAKSLVVAQVSLALVLLSGSAVMVQAFRVLQFSSPGFESDHLLTVNLAASTSRYADGEETTRFFEQVAEQVAATPSVEAAAFVLALPRSPLNPTRTYTVDGDEPAPDAQKPSTIWLAATSGYFNVLGTPILTGRDFSIADRFDSPEVAIVNQSFARRHWPDSSPLGERITITDRSREIVGVVPDVWQELLAGEGTGRSPVVYLPHSQAAVRSMNLLVRTSGPPAAIGQAVRGAIWEVDPRVSIASVLTFDEYVAQFFGTKAINILLTLFGGLALFLAAIGIYGTIAFSVGRRSHEIGLRMALGARYGDILRLIGFEGMRLLLVGLAVGVPGVALMMWGTSRALQGLVSIEISVVAPFAVLLIVVAAIATYLPARRAAALEPVEALRVE